MTFWIWEIGVEFTTLWSVWILRVIRFNTTPWPSVQGVNGTITIFVRTKLHRFANVQIPALMCSVLTEFVTPFAMDSPNWFVWHCAIVIRHGSNPTASNPKCEWETRGLFYLMRRRTHLRQAPDAHHHSNSLRNQKKKNNKAWRSLPKLLTHLLAGLANILPIK